MILPETMQLLMKVLAAPISSGYLMAFCKEEKNEEYVQFYLAVEEYKAVTKTATAAPVKPVPVKGTTTPTRGGSGTASGDPPATYPIIY